MSSSAVRGTPGLAWTVCVLNWCYIDFGERTGPDKKGRNVQLCIAQLCPETRSQGKGVGGQDPCQWYIQWTVLSQEFVLEGLKNILSFCQGEKKKKKEKQRELLIVPYHIVENLQ